MLYVCRVPPISVPLILLVTELTQETRWSWVPFCSGGLELACLLHEKESVGVPPLPAAAVPASPVPRAAHVLF